MTHSLLDSEILPHPESVTAEPLTVGEIDALEPTLRARVWATIRVLREEHENELSQETT